jgi:hypothetical protein
MMATVVSIGLIERNILPPLPAHLNTWQGVFFRISRLAQGFLSQPSDSPPFLFGKILEDHMGTTYNLDESPVISIL